ncbi:uncharacterized protein LOC108208776 isoform X2 [Daucus carota subsp. sativus]|uniref:uncharacterized protein LOC108208776 isoform X2 n=1 Tax=Daucus carota subsp. sativus TaxID=79200 RepID=UPI0007EF690D|nr:PREDICTED: ankyrin repeat and SAM domain-containing protein 1A-like isoform X2 [Daucus carota subsp. sativus]
MSPGRNFLSFMDLDALYDAAISGDADAISKLAMEADRLNQRGETILHIESINGNTERVRFILRHFASKNLLSFLGSQKETVLAWPAYFGYTEVVEALIDAARQLPSSLSNNITQNHVSSFHAFLRHADNDSETALCVAARRGHTIIAKLLVEADPADKHIPNKDGKTPIYMAAENGYHDIVKLICTTCTSPLNFDGPGGSTALHAAINNLHKAKEEDKDVIRVMINAAKRANVPKDDAAVHESFAKLFNKIDKHRRTILELAVEGNYVDVVALILEENPAYRHRAGSFIGLMPLIYEASDKESTGIASNCSLNLTKLALQIVLITFIDTWIV